jgi:hypothetical protein
MTLDVQKANNNPQKVSVKVSSATYERSPYARCERRTAFHGAKFKGVTFCVLVAPSCQFWPTTFKQTETAVKQNVITDVPFRIF